MPGEGVHASRSLPGAHGPEDRHSGIQSPLGDGEPGGIENLPCFDRVMHLADHDGRGLLFGIERPRRERGEGGLNPFAVPRTRPSQTDRRMRPESMTVTKGET